MTEPLSARHAGWAFAGVCGTCGLLMAFALVVDADPVTWSLRTQAALGAAVLVAGALAIFLPWDRWRRGAMLLLVPLPLAATTAFHAMRGDPPLAGAVASVIVLAWVGVAHPRGTALRFSPAVVVIQSAPGLLAGHLTLRGTLAALVGALAAVALAETLAWVTELLRESHRVLARTQETLRTRESRFRSLVQNASDVVTVVAPDGLIRYQSAAASRAFGFAPTDLVDTSLADWVHPDDRGRVQAWFEDALRQARRTTFFECRLRHLDGSWRDCGTTAVNLLHEEHVEGVALYTRDVSERKALEAELSRQAFHDVLTGLANRSLFTKRVESALARAQRQVPSVAVLFLDLDGFKTINDSLGHAAGDELLVAAAGRLGGCLRSGSIAARLGGDEFAVLLQDLELPSDASRVAERILEGLRAPFVLHGQEVVVRASVGVAVATPDVEGAGDLLRNADVAMYVAKSNGKGHHVVFQPRMHAAVLARLELEADLRRAVERGEFVLHYQPVVELRTGRIVALESLVRWQRSGGELVEPARFIGVAEETGLILGLGAWVLRQACLQAREWQRRHRAYAALCVSVNLSARQLQQAGFVEGLARLLDESELSPRTLILEITESVLMQDTGGTVERLERLKELGVRLAIDDFGTGYSSLSYIRRFKIDYLKMDKSFLESVGGRLEDATLARAIINLGHSLGLLTVAEGIERPEQVAQLRGMGCQLGQGFHFAPALEPGAVDDFLAGCSSGELRRVV